MIDELPAELAALPPKARFAKLLQEKARRINTNRLEHYKPYAKQRAFHDAGAAYRERLFRAGNQLGKTWAAAYEVAMHLTGRYPEWWAGKRFDRPVRWLAGSESTELTRKGIQRLLFGSPEDRKSWGTGAIPQSSLIGDWYSMRSGVADAIASATIKHVSGGNSTIQLASYDQGRTKWQADTVDGVWFDEEPKIDIYSEGLTRTNSTMGPVLLTLTPLLGMSEVLRRFLSEPSPDRADINMTIEDAEHYSAEDKARIIASYQVHEREARARGIPILGSGRIYPVEEALISESAIQIPDHWPRLCALDFGWDHPTGAVWGAWDRDNDTIHIYDAYRVREQPVAVHAAAVRARGEWIPVAWPHDGLQHDKGAGIELANQYLNNGCNMLAEMATFPETPERAGQSRISVEAGVSEMLDRMLTGRLKVATHLADWFDEFRLFHRKDGKIVKEYDDLLSATRYLMMMLRFAAEKPKKRETSALPAYGGAGGWMT